VNVLRGDMSLISPRPHALGHDNYFEKVLEDYAFRHHVKPGMTGWAHVNGLRGTTPTVDLISRRVKMDLWYINNWTLWLDVRSLRFCASAGVRGRTTTGRQVHNWTAAVLASRMFRSLGPTSAWIEL